MGTPMVLDDVLSERVRQLAQLRRRPASALLDEALTQYLAHEEAQAAFVSEGDAAWSEYLATGRHLTGEETRRWLGTWATAGETPAPDCHE